MARAVGFTLAGLRYRIQLCCKILLYGHRRGRRAGGGGWDEGEWDGDGLFGEHHGARGFDCPPDRGSDDGYGEDDGF